MGEIKSVGDILAILIDSFDLIAKSLDQEWNVKPKPVEESQLAFSNAIQHVVDVSARFSFIFRGKKELGEVGTYADNVNRSIMHLAESAKVFFKSSSVHSLVSKDMVIGVKKIIESMTVLASSLKDNIEEDVKISVGKVWDSCDSLKEKVQNFKLSLYVANHIKMSILLVKDAFSELKEYEEHFSNDNNDGESTEENLTPEAISLLKNCQLVLKVVLGLFKQVSILVSNIKNESSNEVSEWLISIIERVDNISAQVDDLAILFYEEFTEVAFFDMVTLLEEQIFSMIQFILTNDEMLKHEVKLQQLKKTIESFFVKAKENPDIAKSQ